MTTLLIPGVLGAAGISGMVSAEGGGALEGVEVRILDTGGDYFNLTTTDHSGAYVFNTLDAGSYLIWTKNGEGFIDELYDDIPCAGGCNPFGGTPVPLGTGQDVTGIDFILLPGGRIAGTVADESSSTLLEGVEVKIYDALESLTALGTTSASGDYLSPTGLPAGDYFVRTSNDAGYFDEVWDDIPCPGACDVTVGDIVTVTLGSTTDDIDFSLSPGGQIAGVVTSSGDGAPIDRVRIDIYDAGGGWTTSATPGTDGAYVTDAGLSPGTYFAVTDNWWGHIDELYDDIPCFSGCSPVDGTPIVVGAGTTSGIDFALDPGGWITGVITDGATGLPIEDAGVEVYTEDGRRVMTALADSNGVYWASGLPTGNFILRAYSWAGYVAELYDDVVCVEDCDFSEATPVAVNQPAITSGIDFSLGIGAIINGTVTQEASGSPITNADVLILDDEGMPVVDAMVDAFGNFDSGAIPAGTYFAVTDSWGDWMVDEVYDDIPCADFCEPESGTPIVLIGGQTVTLSIQLGLGGAVSGSVVSEAGTPAVDCDVHVIDDQGVLVTVAFTDENGDFSVGSLPGGNYFLLTHNYDNLVDQLWENVECVVGCDPTSGTAILVEPEETSGGIDFILESAELFSDGFESGDTSAW
jgi:hypothetical protein